MNSNEHPNALRDALRSFAPATDDAGWAPLRKRLRRRRQRRRGLRLSVGATLCAVALWGWHLGQQALQSPSHTPWAPVAQDCLPAPAAALTSGPLPATKPSVTFSPAPLASVGEPAPMPAAVPPIRNMHVEIALLHQATQTEPANPVHYQRLGMVYLEQKDYCLSRQHLSIARQLDCERQVIPRDVDFLLTELKSRTESQCVCYLDNRLCADELY
jgi:hypothetical protein